MKHLLLASAFVLAFTATGALAEDTAQPANAPAMEKHMKKGEHMGRYHRGMMFKKMDADKDGVVTRDEMTKFHSDKFAKMDTNNDGKLTKEEIKMCMEKKRAEHKAMDAKPGTDE